jgi:transposase
MDRVEQGWIGIDAGKGHHHAVLIDRDGQRLLSRRVINDQPDLVALINTVQDRVVDPVWAIDLAAGSASLLIALLLQHGQRVVYLPGIAVNRASAGYRGEGKTDAKDAAIIADQARMRRDLRELHVLDEDIAQLQLLSSYRADLAADRTRSINRLRGLLATIFPALERVLDFTNRGPLILISGFQTPAAIRQLGAGRLAGWLKRRGVRGAGRLAHAAVEAANRQTAQVPGQAAAANLIVRLAQTVLDLDRQLTDLDREVAGIFKTHVPSTRSTI